MKPTGNLARALYIYLAPTINLCAVFRFMLSSTHSPLNRLLGLSIAYSYRLRYLLTRYNRHDVLYAGLKLLPPTGLHSKSK